MSEDYHDATLEELLYRIRDEIGEAKNDVFANGVVVPKNGFPFSEAAVAHFMHELEESGAVVYVDPDRARELIMQRLNAYKDTVPVSHIAPRGMLADRERNLLQILQEVYDDPFVQNASPKLREQAYELIGNLREQATHLTTDMPVHGLQSFSDEGKALYECLENIAKATRSVDHLTGLRQKAYFDSVLDARIAEYFKQPTLPFSVIAIDVNELNQYNNLVGYEQANEFLRQGAGILKENIHGIVARTGGDEFSVLLSGADIDGAKAMAERVANTLDKEHKPRVQESWTAKWGTYNPAFDNIVVDQQTGETINYTSSIGITCTDLAGKPNIFQRLQSHFRTNSGNADATGFINSPHYLPVCNAIQTIAQSGDMEDALIEQLRVLDSDQRHYLVEHTRNLLVKESSQASHLSKHKKDGKRSYVSVYDPDLPAEDYQYRRDRTKTSVFFK